MATAVIALRSALFALAAGIWTVIISLIGIPLLVLPRGAMRALARPWSRGVLLCARVCCGLDYRLVGRENVPDGAGIIACKHQSAWDTVVAFDFLKTPIFVLKRELFAVPLFGWYMWKAGHIGIDRAAGAKALRKMLPKVKAALAEGCQVIIFPEGTRTAPGSHRSYQPGVAAIYVRNDVPLTPVALNSGMFWGRRRFLKFPGTITLKVLPPLPPRLDRRRVMQDLQSLIEAETDRLCADAAHLLSPHGPPPHWPGAVEEPPVESRE